MDEDVRRELLQKLVHALDEDSVKLIERKMNALDRVDPQPEEQ